MRILSLSISFSSLASFPLLFFKNLNFSTSVDFLLSSLRLDC